MTTTDAKDLIKLAIAGVVLIILMLVGVWLLPNNSQPLQKAVVDSGCVILPYDNPTVVLVACPIEGEDHGQGHHRGPGADKVPLSNSSGN